MAPSGAHGDAGHGGGRDGLPNAAVRVAMGAQASTAYPTGLLTGAVTDAVTARRVQWCVLVTMTLLILGAAAATQLERLLPGAAPLPPRRW
ncbi:hypothetical protein [Streptomyces sp. NPDC102462]|uniref:hypothetical protein n=1 Tax=Streptomyces sp. NPDC102462 TaxID=3366178 RepID=UPI00380F79D8